MEAKILKVTGQGDPMMVPSKKQEGGQLAKCYIHLKELGGDYADEYLVVMFGNLAQCRFAEGSVVAASLEFRTHESNGAYYQDVVARDIVELS
jgi:hypothetical protein